MLRPVELPPRRQVAMEVAEIALDALFVEVNDRRDDVAWALAPRLRDVFAEIGLDHLDPRGFEMGIETDLLRRHRFAFGDNLGSGRIAEAEHDGPGLGGVACVMHFAPAFGDLALVSFEVEIEVSER